MLVFVCINKNSLMFWREPSDGHAFDRAPLTVSSVTGLCLM
jgi:hypothetical protein